MASPQGHTEIRQIHPTWNAGLVVASVAISLLGAFTTTQLMCQARVSRALVAVVTWTLLASLTFGFCSIWSLHMVATLACELDLEVELNAPLTILSAFLAVAFTFLAISDIIWERYQQSRCRKVGGVLRRGSAASQRRASLRQRSESEEHLLNLRASEDQDVPQAVAGPTRTLRIETSGAGRTIEQRLCPLLSLNNEPEARLERLPSLAALSPNPHESDRGSRCSLDSDKDDIVTFNNWGFQSSRRHSDWFVTENLISMGRFNSIRTQSMSHLSNDNPFKTTATVIWMGLTTRNVLKGFVWSLAVTCMHYIGIRAINVPGGILKLHAGLVVVSALISWMVCCIGCILMPSMETHLGQQLLFSCVASSGVAAMHYTGMAALSFYTTIPPTDNRGYPPGLSVAIISIAIITCLAANGLLAHSATLARNKLAEIVRTRKRLWAAIAQKENAEAAALARSEFIASASHEIRTPLHQLQGYSDLMARCPLPDDARLLLFAIQDATRTLSLITNNVLDWSRLEKGEAVTRPSNLDVRVVCESIIKLLPRRDDDLEVELMAVVAPDVPNNVFLDETYLQRIVMNLVSNALKFTTSGYVSFVIERQDGKLMITVRDTGIGIPEVFLPHLFEPFKQAQTRGAERGTGLGLSIVEQLLEKVKGSIQVESRHRDDRGIGPDTCGSKFTVEMPIQNSEESIDSGSPYPLGHRKQQLAYFGPLHTRVYEGLATAWDLYNVDVSPVAHIEALSADFKYAWVDCKTLTADQKILQCLVARTELTVLVPFDSDEGLHEALGNTLPHHFVTFQRPWIFHHIVKAVIDGTSKNMRLGSLNRTVRFAPDIDLMDERPREDAAEVQSIASSEIATPDLVTVNAFIRAEPATVLLVEDNKINQRLGSKMLKTLGYDVVLASDGQEAVDLLHDHATAAIVDIILMDQSMPRKDGLTATKEIRELEVNGTIIGATRWKDQPDRRNRRPILAVTAVVGPAHEAMCKSVGTDDFLPKPLSLALLKETLQKYVSDDSC